MNIKDKTFEILACCYEVHDYLGPGLMESVYQQCLEYELVGKGFAVDKEKKITIQYKNIEIDNYLKADLIIDNEIILELKSVKEIAEIHLAQLITYLKITGLRTGFVVNFNSLYLKDGIRRIDL